MNFFDDFPAPEAVQPVRGARFVPPPWVGAPDHELPTVVHIGQFLHNSPTLMLAVRSASVFSVGCMFDLVWIIRRADEDNVEWATLHATIFQHGPNMGPHSADRQLLFGVQLPDGKRARTGLQDMGAHMNPTQQPEPPTLTFRGGGGSGGDDEVSASGNLWLWPLPDDGEVRLVAQWKALGMEEAFIVLDGAQLRAAAARAQPFWS
ncbi:hypothetical protein [Paenarthrobacter sp. FR1]|uniref:hypothetical protein n=1 Tax=Paenarthrobacter sp. FR1 TaxID=3439548 RepID=UPI003DA34AB1